MNFRRVLAVLYSSLVLVLSLRPSPGVPGSEWDKAYHFLAYAVMSFLFMLASARNGKPFAMRAVGVFVAVVLFGIAVEFLQSFTATRHAEAYDVLANALGALTGVAAFRVIKNRAEVKR